MKKLFLTVLALMLGACFLCVSYAAVNLPAIVERQHLSAPDMLEIFEACTGYAGTAGCSLKEAIAAENIASFARRCETADAEQDALFNAVDGAWNALDEEQREEFVFNIAGIDALLECAFSDYHSVQGIFDDAGIELQMRELIADVDICRHWTALYDCISAVAGIGGAIPE